MIRQFLRSTIKPHFFGKRRLQPFWQRLHSWALEGMNIGRWEAPLDSGEIWVLKYISGSCRSGNGHPTRIIFDVGANIGLYSREVITHFGERVHLYSFEPSTATFELLRRNLEAYPNVSCERLGFSHSNRSAILYSVSADHCLSSVHDRFRFDDFGKRNESSQRTEELVALTTLDAYCSQRRIDHITLLKVDVEGHELGVLQGARQLIKNQQIDFIQFEFGGTDVDSKTFMHDFFRLLGSEYRFYRIVRDGIVSVEPYHEKSEIFLYSNFLCISRKLPLRHVS